MIIRKPFKDDMSYLNQKCDTWFFIFKIIECTRRVQIELNRFFKQNDTLSSNINFSYLNYELLLLRIYLNEAYTFIEKTKTYEHERRNLKRKIKRGEEYYMYAIKSLNGANCTFVTF